MPNAEDFRDLVCPLCGCALCAIREDEIASSIISATDYELIADCPGCGSLVSILYTQISGDDSGEDLIADISAEVEFEANLIATPSRTRVTVFCVYCGEPHVASIHIDPHMATKPELISEGKCASCGASIKVQTIRTNRRVGKQTFVIHNF